MVGINDGKSDGILEEEGVAVGASEGLGLGAGLSVGVGDGGGGIHSVGRAVIVGAGDDVGISDGLGDGAGDSVGAGEAVGGRSSFNMRLSQWTKCLLENPNEHKTINLNNRFICTPNPS